jgi:hypothetical protein
MDTNRVMKEEITRKTSGHQHFTVRKIDEPEHAVHEGVSEGDQRKN